MMAGELSYSPTTDQLVYTPISGQLALNCFIVPCSECFAHGPITATITVTGGCDADPGCYDNCSNDVVSLIKDVGGGPGWAGSNGTAPTHDLVRVGINCNVLTAVWTLTVDGLCNDGTSDAHWQVDFVPEGCEMDNGNGYPTHSGINMGEATTGDIRCNDGCIPTVALS